MQLLISKCSQANGKWTDQFTWEWGMGNGEWVFCLPPHPPHLPHLPMPIPHSPKSPSKI
jgi:hypothetical protein